MQLGPIKKLGWMIPISIAVISVGIPILYSVMTKEVKRLEYQVTSVSPLIETETAENAHGGITILLNEEKVLDPHLVVVKLVQAGTLPIKREDFDGNLQIQISGVARVIQANIADSLPVAIPAEVAIEETSAILLPLLLNPADTLTISMITEGRPNSIDVAGRIVGVKSIEKVENNDDSSLYAVGVVLIVWALVLAVGFAALLEGFTHRNKEGRHFPIPTRSISFIVLGMLAPIVIVAGRFLENLGYGGWVFALWMFGFIVVGQLTANLVFRDAYKRMRGN